MCGYSKNKTIKIKMTKIFWIVLVLLSVVNLAEAQIDCENCYQQSINYSFPCNGRNCDSFLWPSDNEFKPIPLYDVYCRQRNYDYEKECYYQAEQSTPFNKWVACNFTMPGCKFCDTGDSCYSCYLGYYKYTDNIQQRTTKCRKCSEAILGCVTCQNQQSCNQCEIPYLLINGICYERDGKSLPGGSTVETTGTQLDSISTILIVSVVLNGIGFLAIALVIFIKRKAKNYNPLLQNHN